MVVTSQIVDEIKSVLNNEHSLFYDTIVSAFDEDIKPMPINKGIVSVGIYSMYLGEASDGVEDITQRPVKNRDFTARMMIRIHAPYYMGEKAIYRLLDRVITALVDETKNKYKISNIYIYTPKYLRFTESMQLNSAFTIHGKISFPVTEAT